MKQGVAAAEKVSMSNKITKENSKSIAYYDKKAKEFADSYEKLDPKKVHKHLIAHLPKPPAEILDIGSGSGRDAAWFAKMGYEVTAIEPAPALLKEAKRRHKNSNITWLNDQMPKLDKLPKKADFDLIIMTGVWMHIKPEMRPETLKRLKTLLAPSGQLAIYLRHGTPDANRDMYKVSENELKTLSGKDYPIKNISGARDNDEMGRNDVWWQLVTITAPAPKPKNIFKP